MYRFNNISNTDLSILIDEWIKNERDRKIMKRRLLDGITHERIAEEFELSVKQIYQTLAAELGRIKADEAAKKWEDEAEERNEKMAQLLCSTFSK